MTATAALVLMMALSLVHAAPARAAGDATGPPAPGAPSLGALLDWATDSAAAHAERLGAPAAVHGRPVPLPMSEQEQGYLRDFFAQLAGQGSHALLTVRPEVPLAEVDDVVDWVGLSAYHDETGDGLARTRFPSRARSRPCSGPPRRRESPPARTSTPATPLPVTSP